MLRTGRRPEDLVASAAQLVERGGGPAGSAAVDQGHQGSVPGINRSLSVAMAACRRRPGGEHDALTWEHEGGGEVQEAEATEIAVMAIAARAP